MSNELLKQALADLLEAQRRTQSLYPPCEFGAIAAIRAELAKPEAQPSDFSDAYQGAREDVAIWKKRALEAEETARQLNRALADEVNGPTFMGEPAPQPEAQQSPEARGVPDEMDSIASKYAHKLALDLECVLADYSGKWWDTAIKTIGEYREAMNAIHERESPTFMGEPRL